MNTARLLLLALCSTAALAQAQTVVPHTFQDGTPAEASEVNENFDALAESIDEAAVGRIVLKVGEEVLGYPVGDIGFVTQQGFYTLLYGNGTIELGGIYWESDDCSGQAYGGWVRRSGLVFFNGDRSTGLGAYWAVPLDATGQEINTRSTRYGAQTCVANTGRFTGFKIVPNDPAVTGIQNKGVLDFDEYQGPIYYEVR